MKIKELKEMIKAAFLSEADFTNAQDDDAALGGMYDDLYEEDLDEMIANLDEADEEESIEDIIARITGTPLAEAKGDEEETDIEVDAEEETTDSGEEKSDSIVVDKKIVSLSSLPQETRKILDSLETLRAQAEEFGDQKFITQVGNTITFFTRDFVVGGDEPTKAKVDESLEILRMKKLAGLLTEGEYAKALLRENNSRIDLLRAKLEKMSSQEFTNFVKKVGDYDLWRNFPKGIDPFNNISDRMEVISTFEDEDVNKYLNTLRSNKGQRLREENSGIDLLIAKLKKMSPQEFTNFVKKVGDYDLWSDAPNDIDPFNNISDRMEIISTFEDEDVNKYLNTLGLNN
jgi:hypothetical protein